MARSGGMVVFCLVAFLLVRDASCGKLRDLEKKATRPAPSSVTEEAPKKSRSGTYDSASTSSFGSGTYPSSGGGDSFLGSFFAWLVTSPLEYRHDDPSSTMASRDGEVGEWAVERASIFPQHRLGEATAPYVRLDYNWQYVDSDIDADDVRIELGYKALAFHGRTSRYTDKSDGFKLDMNQYYGVLRYGGFRPDFLPGTFEAAIGVGVSQIQGDEEHSSGAITIPLKYYPAEWCGLEFRPAWYKWDEKSIGDYDVSASLGYRYVQLRGGYRWMMMKGEGHFNNGPYAGISASF